MWKLFTMFCDLDRVLQTSSNFEQTALPSKHINTSLITERFILVPFELFHIKGAGTVQFRLLWPETASNWTLGMTPEGLPRGTSQVFNWAVTIATNIYDEWSDECLPIMHGCFVQIVLYEIGGSRLCLGEWILLCKKEFVLQLFFLKARDLVV